MNLSGSQHPSSSARQQRLLRRAGVRGLPGLFLVLLSMIAVGACSSDPADDATDSGSGDGDGDNPSVGGNGSGSGGGGSFFSGGSSASGGDSGLSVPGTGGGNGDGGNGPTCASSTKQADIKPIDMYIMFDRSSSMNNMTVPTLWEQATSALVSFLQADGSSGFGVALRFFPDDLPVAGCRGAPGGGFQMGTGGEAAAAILCEPAACQEPLVPIGTLEAGPGDPQETLLVNAINAKDVLIESQGTPTHPALTGALDWGRGRLVAAPDRLPIVVLVTDGEPTGCINEIDVIAALAADGLADGIRTYVVGLEGSSEGAINGIATGGGTEGIFIGGPGVDAGTALIDALNEIRGEALACEFATPTTDTGAIVDTSKVNLVVTLGDASEVPVLKVADEVSCADGVNWYYTDDTKATIALCQAACDIVQGDNNASIDIQLGCASQVIE